MPFIAPWICLVMQLFKWGFGYSLHIWSFWIYKWPCGMDVHRHHTSILPIKNKGKSRWQIKQREVGERYRTMMVLIFFCCEQTENHCNSFIGISTVNYVEHFFSIIDCFWKHLSACILIISSVQSNLQMETDSMICWNVHTK